MSDKLRVKKLHPNAKLPTKAYDLDAGFDLYALENTIIYPINDTEGHEIMKVRTGIAMEIPIGYFGKVEDKSGFVTKNGLKVVAGIIDCGYKGEILVCFTNLSGRIIEIKAKEKIAQLIILPLFAFEVVEVNKLTPSSRGSNGFGSSGRF